MKVKRLEFILLIKLSMILLFFKCTNINNCKANEDVEKTFNHYYSTALGVIQEDSISLNIEQALAIDYLSKISGINHNLQFEDMVYIKNEEEFRSLMRDWKDWYDKHKCEISANYSDSLDIQAKEYLKLY